MNKEFPSVDSKVEVKKEKKFDILKINGIDSERSLKLEKENNAYWLKLDDVEFNYGSVEGKLLTPEKRKNEEVVVFVPGTPGGSVQWFENKIAATLTEEGYAVFVMRHNGTDINCKDKDGMQFINCIERAEDSRLSKSNRLGDVDEYSFEKRVLEPALTMQAFAKYKKVHYISHSSGGLDVAVSIKHMKENHPEFFEQINFGNWISISGQLGKSLDGKINTDRDFKYSDQWLIDAIEEERMPIYNQGKDPKNAVEKELKKSVEILGSLYEKKDWFPKEKIKSIHINSDFDPFISVESGRGIQDITGGLLINDYSIAPSLDEEKIVNTINENTKLDGTEKEKIIKKIIDYKPDKMKEKIKNPLSDSEVSDYAEKIKTRTSFDVNDAHEFPQMMPETLLRLVKMKVSGKHEATVVSPFPKEYL